MSLAQKLNQAQEANAALTEKVAELESAVSEKDAAIEAMVAEHQAKVEELEQASVELKEQSEAMSAELAEVKEQSEASAEELEAAKIQLANPAHVAAAAQGEAEAADSTVTVEEDAEEPTEEQKAQALIDEYIALPQGRVRSAWYAEHGEELQAAWNLIAKED